SVVGPIANRPHGSGSTSLFPLTVAGACRTILTILIRAISLSMQPVKEGSHVRGGQRQNFSQPASTTPGAGDRLCPARVVQVREPVHPAAFYLGTACRCRRPGGR